MAEVGLLTDCACAGAPNTVTSGDYKRQLNKTKPIPRWSTSFLFRHPKYIFIP